MINRLTLAQSPSTDVFPPRDAIELNIGIFGAAQVGKTSLITRYIAPLNFFPVEYNPTVLEKRIRTVTIGEHIVQLRIIDTSGSSRFNSLRQPTITQCDGFIFVFSITDRESFQTIKELLRQIMGLKQPYYLVGNKTDLECDRVVAYREAKELCQGAKYIETSAKTIGEPWNEIFEGIIRECIPFKLQKLAEARKHNTPTGYVEICDAAYHGDVARVRELVEQGVDVNQINEYDGDTALHKSAEQGHVKVVEYLIDNKADINAINKKGYTALHLAALKGKEDVVKFLIIEGAVVNTAENTYGNTPIHDASKDSILSLLIERGLSINVTDKIGRTVLHNTYGSFHSDRMATLIKMGANVNATDNMGWTPLHYFCYASMSVDVTELLIKLGANVNLADHDGWTPLHIVCWRGRRPFMQKLLDNGCECEIKNKRDKTPRMLAEERGHNDIARILMLKGETLVEKSIRIFTEVGSKTGYLTKEGHLRKSWKRRYFVLTMKFLKYYADDSLKRLKGSILLSNSKVSPAPQKRNFCLLLVEGGRNKRYYIHAANEKEQSEWLAVLEYVISQN